MQSPLQVQFKGIEVSDAVYDRIKQRAAKLEGHFKKIVSCKVVMEKSQCSVASRLGKSIYHVHIEVQMPGETLVVERDPKLNGGLENMYITIKLAFNAMERRLSSFMEKKTTPFRNHHLRQSEVTSAQVIKLWPDEECGFLRTHDGREIYFNENSVTHHGYQSLEIGDRVRFVEEQGNEGPQASTVVVLDRYRKRSHRKGSGQRAMEMEKPHLLKVGFGGM